MKYFDAKAGWRGAIAVASALLVAAAAPAAPVVDINTLSPTIFLSGAQVNCCGATGNTVAASIEAAVAGQLTRVDLQIVAPQPGHQLTMYLAPTNAAGLPVTDLSAAYASYSIAVPVSPAFIYPIVSIDVLSAGLFLDVGEDYAVILTNTLPVAGSSVVGWAFSQAPSTRLQPYDRSGSTLAWDPCIFGLGCGTDVALRTFVDPELRPAAVPEPGSLLLAGLGVFAAVRRLGCRK